MAENANPGVRDLGPVTATSTAVAFPMRPIPEPLSMAESAIFPEVCRRLAEKMGEVERMKQELATSQSRAALLEGALSAAQRSTEAAQSEAEKAQRSTEAAQNDAEKAQINAERIQKKVKRLQTNMNGLKDENAALVAAKTQLEGRVAEFERKHTECQKFLAERQQLCVLIEQWRNHCATIQTTHAAQENALRVEVQRLEAAVKEHEDAKSGQTAKIAELEAQIGPMESQLNALSSQVREKEQAIAALKEERDQAKSRLATSEEALRDQKTLNERFIEDQWEKVLSAYARKHTEQTDRINDLTRANEELRKANEELCANAARAKAILHHDEGVQAEPLPEQPPSRQRPTGPIPTHTPSTDEPIDGSASASASTSTRPATRRTVAVTRSAAPSALVDSTSASCSTVSCVQEGGGPLTDGVRSALNQYAAHLNVQARLDSATQPRMAKSSRTRSGKQVASKASTSRIDDGGRRRFRGKVAKHPDTRTMEMPDQYKRGLKKLVAVDIPELSELSEHTFTREELAEKLGGNTSDTVVQFGDLKKPLSHAHGLAGCFFGFPQLMPWLPKIPGEHGYGFIDRWCDGDELSEKPLQCAMFMPADKTGERWKYFGQYLLDRMAPISTKDWAWFTWEFQDTWCAKHFWEERHGKKPFFRPEDERPLTDDEMLDVRKDFGAGEPRVPCAKLICEQYNSKLLEDLCSDLRASTRERKPTWKRRHSETPGSSTSRKRSRSSL